MGLLTNEHPTTTTTRQDDDINNNNNNQSMFENVLCVAWRVTQKSENWVSDDWSNLNVFVMTSFFFLFYCFASSFDSTVFHFSSLFVRHCPFYSSRNLSKYLPIFFFFYSPLFMVFPLREVTCVINPEPCSFIRYPQTSKLTCHLWRFYGDNHRKFQLPPPSDILFFGSLVHSLFSCSVWKKMKLLPSIEVALSKAFEFSYWHLPFSFYFQKNNNHEIWLTFNLIPKTFNFPPHIFKIGTDVVDVKRIFKSSFLL